MQKKIIIGLIAGSLLILIAVSSFAADGDVIVNGNLTVGGSATVSGNLSAPNLPKYYQSPDQTITSAGALTLPHGLGVEPVLIQVVLKCTTAEAGYSVGDKIFINPNLSKTSTYAQGVVIVPDSTNLNIRFGGIATYVFSGLNKSTGVAVNLTNTKWVVIFRAFAF